MKDIIILIMAVWPSGKAVDCKSSIPSSNLGAALKYLTIILFLKLSRFMIYSVEWKWWSKYYLAID